jgi:two-component sensor histidine kinase
LILQGKLEGADRLSRLNVHDGIVVVDADGKIQYLSAVAEHLYFRLGYTESLVDTLISELDTNEYAYFSAVERGECLEQRVEEQGVMWIKKVIPLASMEQEGWLAGLISRRRAPNGALVIIEDVTEEARKEQELTIKSAMIQEIHHRVKNHLQTIAALLRMQGRRTSSEEVAEQLRQSVSRILSIAVVHEFLSKDESSVINIHEVCNRIVHEVTSGTLDPDKRVSLHLEGSGPFFLPAQQATSCALIVNELLQNAVEHGFTGRSEGEIHVRLQQTDDSMAIEIQDDGVGLPDGFEPERNGGLGLQIVLTLVREDLKGRFEMQNGIGVRALISFPRHVVDDARPAVA